MSDNCFVRIIGCGNICTDPELKQVGENVVLEFCVATGNTDRNGDPVGKVFTHLRVWGNRGTALAQFLTKGDYVVFDGNVIGRNFEFEGKDHYRQTVWVQNLDVKTKNRGTPTTSIVQDKTVMDKAAATQPF